DVSPDMGLLFPQDILRRAEVYECLQYEAVPSGRVFYQGVQFAVRKCPCAALSELDVGHSVKPAGLPELPDIFPALIDRGAPLDDKRMVPFFCKQVRTEESCRSAPDHGSPAGKRSCPMFRRTVSLFFRLLHLPC